MPSINFFASLTTVLIGIAGANPILLETRTNLEARYATNFVDCSPGQKKKLMSGFGDAAQLSRWAYDNINTDNKALSHYFRTDDSGKEEDLEWARKWWSAIASNNDPTNPPYTFSVRCGKDDNQSCKGGSVAITDAQPQKDDGSYREMLICPTFFRDTTKETVHDLSFRAFEKPRRGKDNSWCVVNNFGWYEVAGVTLLHEMTHLDAVGAVAGVEARQVKNDKGEDWFKTHGTDDVGGLGNSYPVAARKLAELWQKDPKGNYLKPYQNAENLAAAALEFYMMDRCKKAGEDIGEIKL